MPLWLIKILPYGAGVVALIFAVWYIDHRGYERAEAQNAALETKLDLQTANMDLLLKGDVENVQTALQSSMNSLTKDLGTSIDGIESTNKTIIQPTITKEIANDPHLTSTDCALPVGLWGSINQARSLSQFSPTSAAGPTGQQAVPAGKPAQR